MSYRRPTKKQIEEANQHQLLRQQKFRRAAEYASNALAQFAEVQKVALIGSVAIPLSKEVPRFREFNRHGIEIYHECKDVDLAVWISDLTRLDEMRVAIGRSTNELLKRENIGVAHHQVDTFLLEPETNRFLGNLCKFGVCPKGHEDCDAPGCGDVPFLKLYEGFVFHARAILPDRIVVLFERG
jgi:hypothetical protein